MHVVRQTTLRLLGTVGTIAMAVPLGLAVALGTIFAYFDTGWTPDEDVDE